MIEKRILNRIDANVYELDTNIEYKIVSLNSVVEESEISEANESIEIQKREILCLRKELKELIKKSKR